MGGLKIIHASAGSGKTFALTEEYLRFLFKSKYNYRYILAVTFTNKATEEMKSRILAELHKLAKEEKSPYMEMLRKDNNLDVHDVQTKATDILSHILHDYSRFSVTTIDSFFQRIVKAFAREAGLQMNFDVELDTTIVLEAVTEQLLENLESDLLLQEWLQRFAEERIENGKSWLFTEEIIRLGSQLFTEEFKSFSPDFLKKLSDKSLLKEIQEKLYQNKNYFESTLVKYGNEGMELMNQNALQPEDFKYGLNGGPGAYFLKLSQRNFAEPGKRIESFLESPENWSISKSEKHIVIQMAVNGGLFDLMQKAVKFYREHSGIYNTGTQILSKFYTLGILTDLAKEIRQYVFENNVFILADTGSLLRTLIGNNDAPFIYEKTGQAFRYFMIDEFQDTSQIQWDNFKPLISNSLGEGHTNLLVGDIKQSIYRWRNSDWRIMSEQVENDFVQHDYSIQSLLVNWRSTYNIIAFNNSIFSQLPSVLQQKFNSDCKADSENIEVATSLQNIIKKVFEDSAQLLPHRESKEKGYVNTGFFENDDNLWKDRMKPALIHVVEELQNKSYGLKDIAILVRTGNEGREIAELFAEQNKQKPADSPYRYDVISNDSIYLKNSPLVRFIIAFIRYLLQPENLINKAFVKYEYEKYLFPGNSQNDLEDFSFFSEEMENLVIACKIIEREKYLSLSPDEFLEFLILTFQLNRNKEQLVFLQAFQDCVSDFINKYSPELGRFLDYWEEKKDKLTISISEDQDAIRILTIHKAKGLEFKNVIVPFCNWSLDQNARHDNFLWCKSEEAPFNKLDYLPVRYSSSLRNTLFQNFYFAEKARAYIDNLNLLYVTFTRAKQNIFAFAPFPKRKKSDDEFTINTVGDLLFNVFNSAEKMQVSEEFPCIRLNDYWDGNKKIFSFGKLTFSEFSNETPINISELTDYQSYEIKEKLKQHFQWSIPDEADDQLADTPMAIGNLMHRVFQNIVTVHDIEPALQSFLFEGIISSDEKESLRKTILEKLSQQPLADWFSGKWTVKNEADIIVSKQSMVRPDRVMIKDKNAIVVDYKFGMMQNARYTTQVRDYAGYLMQMGYNKVEGFVWYVSMDIIERVA